MRKSASVFIVETLACDLIFQFRGDFFNFCYFFNFTGSVIFGYFLVVRDCDAKFISNIKIWVDLCINRNINNLIYYDLFSTIKSLFHLKKIGKFVNSPTRFVLNFSNNERKHAKKDRFALMQMKITKLVGTYLTGVCGQCLRREITKAKCTLSTPNNKYFYKRTSVSLYWLYITQLNYSSFHTHYKSIMTLNIPCQ